MQHHEIVVNTRQETFPTLSVLVGDRAPLHTQTFAIMARNIRPLNGPIQQTSSSSSMPPSIIFQIYTMTSRIMLRVHKWFEQMIIAHISNRVLIFTTKNKQSTKFRWTSKMIFATEVSPTLEWQSNMPTINFDNTFIHTYERNLDITRQLCVSTMNIV